jgi:plasmid stabilization system protein ParE
MIRRVILRREAKHDLREAKTWYREISPELGRAFVRRIDDAIALARERPLAFQIVHRTFRRILLHRFPYAIFYHASDDRIVIAAILHQARDQEILESRRP